MFMMVLNYLFLVFVLTFALTSTEQVAEVHAGSQGNITEPAHGHSACGDDKSNVV